MAEDAFVINPPPPVRAYALAAHGAVIGGALTVISASQAWPVLVTVLGVVLLAASVGLVAFAWAFTRRFRVRLVLDPHGYRVESRDGVRSGSWKQVSRVTAGSNSITLHQGPEERVRLVSSANRAEQLDAVAAAIGRHLDAHRGYTTFLGS